MWRSESRPPWLYCRVVAEHMTRFASVVSRSLRGSHRGRRSTSSPKGRDRIAPDAAGRDLHGRICARHLQHGICMCNTGRAVSARTCLVLPREIGYARPGTLAEALELLSGNDGARVLAGGQTLVNVM